MSAPRTISTNDFRVTKTPFAHLEVIWEERRKLGLEKASSETWKKVAESVLDKIHVSYPSSRLAFYEKRFQNKPYNPPRFKSKIHYQYPKETDLTKELQVKYALLYSQKPVYIKTRDYKQYSIPSEHLEAMWLIRSKLTERDTRSKWREVARQIKVIFNYSYPPSELKRFEENYLKRTSPPSIRKRKAKSFDEETPGDMRTTKEDELAKLEQFFPQLPQESSTFNSSYFSLKKPPFDESDPFGLNKSTDGFVFQSDSFAFN